MTDITSSDRFSDLIVQPETLMDKIVVHVANGGSITTLAALWKVRYSALVKWINDDDVRRNQYRLALQDRNEWAIESILHEVRTIARSDIRLIFDEMGAIKPIHEWPEEIARCVAAIETHELFEGYGSERQMIGQARKIKMWDKLRAAELVGKNLKLFIDKHEISGRLTLEDIIAKANQGEEDAVKTGEVEESN